MTEQQPLWTPSQDRIEKTALWRFMQQIDSSITDYDTMYDWSISNPADFWDRVWDFCGIVGDKGERLIADADKMPGAQFFPDARLNFAENLLKRRDDGLAIVFRGEDKVERTLTWADLYTQVARTAAALKAQGVTEGDRVAGYMPNMPETIIAMLATASLGAIWSSASPDFGVQGVLDRFGQIEPKVLFTANGYYYNGKSFSSLDKVAEIVGQMPSVETVVVVPYTEDRADLAEAGDKAVHYADWTEAHADVTEIDFRPMPFNAPLYIMFSSGTTGAPKCIVHGAGGTLIQQLKEHVLHCDIGRDDRAFYFTTCGWMMWNWLVAALGAEATLCLYDGSPFYPDGNVLFDYADAWQFKLFGTSAKYIDALNKYGFKPRETHDLSSVTVLTSTGSPLVPEAFEYVYRDIKQDVQLASISGGTDIISCFALGSPISPVYKGELQKRGLGMAVEVWNDDGQHVASEKGELVCTHPFPSMPVMFWNDEDGSKYKGAYFERFDNIWCHGDYVELTRNGGIIIYGRSDATLNPGGVRIGTAEIYRAVEALDEVVESICIGQDWDDDVRVVLFVILRDGMTLDGDLGKKICTQIRSRCTPRHVPAKVCQVKDIPRTKSGKITEIAVRDVVHGRKIKNVEALANPDALKEYEGLSELQD
ncbi:MAG: acetoacetate--CoA ligase [Alphaproteobacteria bacterium]